MYSLQIEYMLIVSLQAFTARLHDAPAAFDHWSSGGPTTYLGHNAGFKASLTPHSIPTVISRRHLGLQLIFLGKQCRDHI